MKKIIQLLKGVAIGVANVIPGVSGGTIAVIVGIYEKIIDAISRLFKQPIRAIQSIWIYVVGVIIGLIIAVFGISYLYDSIPIITAFIFIGFILGSVPFLCKDVKFQNLTYREFLVFGFMLILVAVLPFLGISSDNIVVFGVSSLFLMFILGAIASITMVVPGVSGSMVLMILGYYNILLDLLKHMYIFENLMLVVSFGFGAIVGIISVSRAIRHLINKRAIMVKSGIIGLVIASPIPIISYLNFSGAGLGHIILSCFALILAFFISYRLTLKK